MKNKSLYLLQNWLIHNACFVSFRYYIFLFSSIFSYYKHIIDQDILLKYNSLLGLKFIIKLETRIFLTPI